MFNRVLLLFGILALAASPVAAQSFDFSQTASGTTNSTLNYDSGAMSVSLQAYHFANATMPSTLGGLNISAFTASTLSFSNRGVGICSPGETGGTTGNSEACPEIDSADEQGKRKINFNEGLLLSFTGAPSVNILKATLNIVDQDDTIGIYGVDAAGLLHFLGFPGTTIVNPTGGYFTVTSPQSNTNSQYELTFTPLLTGYSRYFFTTMTNGSAANAGDGYRLAGMTVAAVPEPAAWGMMLLGFGFIGAQLRRSRRRGVRSTTSFAF